MKRNNSESRRDATVRRLLLLLTVCVFIWGVVAMLQRSSNSDKYVGKVIVNVGTDEYIISGHTVEKLYIDETDSFEPLSLEEISGTLPVIKSNPEKNNMISSMKVSFVKDYVGNITYTVFDKNYTVAVKAQEKLEIPADKGDFYYVKINVKWGKVKNYIAKEYYFAIQLDKSDGS